jgi:hypothetical protein
MSTQKIGTMALDWNNLYDGGNSGGGGGGLEVTPIYPPGDSGDVPMPPQIDLTPLPIDEIPTEHPTSAQAPAATGANPLLLLLAGGLLFFAWKENKKNRRR